MPMTTLYLFHTPARAKFTGAEVVSFHSARCFREDVKYTLIFLLRRVEVHGFRAYRDIYGHTRHHALLHFIILDYYQLDIVYLR